MVNVIIELFWLLPLPSCSILGNFVTINCLNMTKFNMDIHSSSNIFCTVNFLTNLLRENFIENNKVITLMEQYQKHQQPKQKQLSHLYRTLLGFQLKLG